MSDTSLPLSDGGRFGRYRVLRHLSSTLATEVYEAEHHSLGIRVELQVLSPSLREMPMLPEIFVRSARRAAGVRHAHLEEIFDVGVASEAPFFAAPPLDGPSLSLRLGSRWLVADAVTTLLPAIAAVGAIHRAAMVHHDLQPARIALHRDGPSRTRPMVTGFALAAIRERALQARLTARDAMETAPRYVAPEKARGMASGPAADQWSMAAMLYELLAGEPVRPGQTLVEVLRACDREPTLLPELRDDIPPELAAAIGRALARDPEARYARLIDFGRAILPFASMDSEAHWGIELDRVDADPIHGAESDTSVRGRFSLHGAYRDLRSTDLRSLPLADDRDDPFGDGDDHTQTRSIYPDSRSRSRRIAGYVAAALSVGAAGAWMVRGMPAFAPSAATVALPAPTSSAPDEPRSVPLRVTVTPAGATIELDDAVIAHGAFEGKLPLDGRSYRVEARAPGYRTEVRLVDADRPIAIAFELVALAGEAEAEAAPSGDLDAVHDGGGEEEPKAVPAPRRVVEPTVEAPPPEPAPAEAPASSFARPRAHGGLDTANPYDD